MSTQIVNNMLVFSLTAIFSVCAFAAADGDSLQEKQLVYQQAKNYARAVACNTTFDVPADRNTDLENSSDHQTDLDDVYLTRTEFDYTSNKQINTQYLVYWGGEWGCEGGTGSYSYFLTELSRCCSEHPFLVYDSNILDQINSDGMRIDGRFIEQVEFVDDSVLITASGEGDDGGQHPKNRYQYTLIHEPNDGIWELVDEKLIGENTP